MKDKLLTLAVLLLIILLLPLILLFAILSLVWDLIARPYHVAKYKKSHFYRHFGQKYIGNFYNSNSYAIYNAIKESELPFQAIPLRNDRGKIYEFLFIYKDILLDAFPYGNLDYDDEKRVWTIHLSEEDCGEDITIEPQEYIARRIKDYHLASGDLPPTARTVLLISRSELQNVDEHLVTTTPELFVVYDKKNIVEALHKFVSEQ